MTFQVLQDGKEVAPEQGGIVLLKSGPFEIRFSGEVERTALLFTRDRRLASELSKGKGPFVSLRGMGSAYNDGDLLIEKEGKLRGWEDFKKDFGVDEAAKLEGPLKKKLGRLPEVLDAGLMYLHSDEGAKHFEYEANRELEGDLSKEKEIWLVVVQTGPTDGTYFVSLAPRVVRLQFVGK